MLYIVIPAYNEQENIESIVNDWCSVAESVSGTLLVIDDGSTDATYTLLKQMALKRAHLFVLKKKNGGHGDAVLAGYRYAINDGATYIFQTDSDGQTKPEEFWAFWNERERYDAIFGFRKKRGDGFDRKIIENVLCVILWLVFGVKIPDANAPFRLMKASKVKEYIAYLPEHYSLPNVMLTVLFVRNNDKILFKEITFENRKKGHNSMNIRKIVKVGIRETKGFFRLRHSIER